MQQHLIVVGGGAAGFFTAINAATLNPNLKITIVEKSSKLLSKVKISGGGRCNVTHHCFEIDTLSKNYPRGASFLKKAFHQFNAADTVKWFQNRKVQLVAEADGRMFPDTNDSQTIIDCFMNEANRLGIIIKTNSAIRNISIQNEQFNLTVNDELIKADYVCLATGGFPKLNQFDWISKVDNQQIKIETPIPSLFTFNLPQHSITQLMGIAQQQVLVKIKGTKLQQQGTVLITHWGLSGPAVLKLSAFAAKEIFASNYEFTIVVNWLPQFNETSFLQHWKELIQQTNQLIGNYNPFGISNRLWLYLLQQVGINEKAKWATISKEKVNAFVKIITNMELSVKGKTTFKEEFVTAGGIDLSQIDHQSMEHKAIPNLHFAGELLNIDGITGGFNFQNAWTTGYVAAKSIASKSSTISLHNH